MSGLKITVLVKLEKSKMSQEEYLNQRVNNQIDWYDSKSSFNQRWFRRLQVIAILSASTIPFLSGYSSGEDETIRISIGILGLIVAAITAILSLYKFQEHWLEYRTTCESLRHEKHLYLTQTTPYNGDEAFSRFVQRIESLISKENTDWLHYMEKPVKKK